MTKIAFFFIIFLWCGNIKAQTDSAVYAKFTTKTNRDQFYKNTLSRSITKNLSTPLNNDTEEKWMSAFSAIELLNYKQPWINAKLKTAADSIKYRTTDFQQTFLEMLYAGNRKEYAKQINGLLSPAATAKIYAMSALYLLLVDTTKKNADRLLLAAQKKTSYFNESSDSVIMISLINHIKELQKKTKYPTPYTLKNLFAKQYLQGNVVVYSLQRKNRNYPGITIVKDSAGNFITNSNGTIFNVPQLARSLSNMPFYISNGNTPQGIFRLYGFDKSRSSFIGPTENLQATMPAETSIHHFLKDSSLADTVWNKKLYASLLPKQLKNYEPLYQTFYAGEAGRTEIIAHGTTVDPQFYSGQTYYPLTPTAGCLCTKEIWDDNGRRVFSDQQKLADAVKQAGGADGYLIVVEIDDTQKPVTLADILPYLQ